MNQTRIFVRIAAELSPAAVATLLEQKPGLVSASIDRGPLGLCRPCVELIEEAAEGGHRD